MVSGVICEGDSAERANFENDESPTLARANVLQDWRASERHEPASGHPVTSSFTPRKAAQLDAEPIPEPSVNIIQWHSVAIGGSSDERDSPPPSQGKDIQRTVELQVEFDQDTQFYTGLTQDISDVGIFIATYRILPVGTLLRLSFELPCGTKIAARGEVRWIRDTLNAGRPGIGVSLADLSDESLLAIARYCSQNTPLYVEF